jgi:peroxiredoxin
MLCTNKDVTLAEDEEAVAPVARKPETAAEAFALAAAHQGTLKKRLDVYSEQSRRLNPQINEAYDELIAKLTPQKNAGPPPGALMPDFQLPDQDGHLVSLSSLLSQGSLVLSLNRGHWCPWCRLELRALAEICGELQQLGVQVASSTPETLRSTARLAANDQLPFRILTDLDCGYALSLGLMIWAGDEIAALYEKAGLDLPLFQNSDGWFLPIPATFVIGSDGIIKAGMTDPDFRQRMEPEEILAALRTTR